MNTNNQSIRDLTIAYIENALSEVSLLHDAALIEPTLEKFHIERHHASFRGFAPRLGKFRHRAGLKPRPVYTVTDTSGTSLGDPIHEGDLDTLHAENVIERQIAANLDAMLADHADLVALHRAGGGGATPSFRYRPGSALARRTDTEAALENQKVTLRESIEQSHKQQEIEQQRLHSILHQIQEAEKKLDEINRKTRHRLAQMQEAQKVIDRANRIQQHDARRRGVLPSLWETDAPEQENGPEFA